MYLVHFRSKELAKLRPYGRFWHVFVPSGGFMADQDEEDTFTSHLLIRDMDTDVTKIDPREAVYEILEGRVVHLVSRSTVLVNSAWRPNFCIAEKYISNGGRIMLADDSGGHCDLYSFTLTYDQFIAYRSPQGGYGINFGVEDAGCSTTALSVGQQ
jgi:hypothetical protein